MQTEINKRKRTLELEASTGIRTR